MLYQCNLGIRDFYTYTDAMLNNSLFYYYMRDHGLQVYKEESTRDIICLKFDFGSKSYKEERKRVERLFNTAKTDEERENIRQILEKVDKNREKYVALSREQIRTKFYEEGVDVVYQYRDKQGNVEYADKIHYVMLFRTPAKAKLGEVMFINANLYETAHNWLTMGIKLPEKGAKIVEMSAYAPLTTSTIVGTLQIPVENILILEDADSFFKTVAEVVKAQDYTKNSGEKSKRCIVEHGEVEVKNTIWDGQALIDVGSLPDWVNGMCLLRNHMFKACAFKTRIQQFFRDYAAEHGIDYDTWQLTDMFGVKHFTNKLEIVTTQNAIKWKKFIPQMGGTPLKAYEFWCEKIRADGCQWGVVKTDHPSKIGRNQQMSYQMVNTLPLTKEEIGEVARTSIEYVENLKRDPDAFEIFLRQNANEVNHYLMMADLYAHNKEFAKSRWFLNEKKKVINSFVFKLRNGKIFVEGDNLTLCGNPYALLLHAVGQDWQKDPTLVYEEGTIQCYTTRFEDGQYLLGIRNPQNSPNNIVYLHNVKHPLMQRYFEFSQNIMALNNIETDVQSRLNGADYDSDFCFTTNHPQLVKAARICYEQYPTIVNDLQESGLTYNNEPAEYARMDNQLAHSQLGIGWSSNLAQLAMSYYWSQKAKENPSDSLLEQYYHIFIQLSVLAQVQIDSSKRAYQVSCLAEIDRIVQEPCMVKQITYRDGSGKLRKKKKDFPLFMKYTRSIPMARNGELIPYELVKSDKDKLRDRIDTSLTCPMNWLQEHLNKIQGVRTNDWIPTEDFFIKVDGRADWRTTNKVLDIIKEYSASMKRDLIQEYGDPYQTVVKISKDMEIAVEKLKSLRFKNQKVINRLIETALDLQGSNDKVHTSLQRKNAKYSRQILNCLYRMDKDRFLSNFVCPSG